MGALAESVLHAGGEVTGVEPQFFIDKGYEYDEITTLIVTRDMTERKTKMIELGDAFIAFPGGTARSRRSARSCQRCRSSSSPRRASSII